MPNHKRGGYIASFRVKKLVLIILMDIRVGSEVVITASASLKLLVKTKNHKTIAKYKEQVT